VMRALIEGNIPKPSSVRPVDAKLEAIVMKALAPAPEDRYRTAQEFRNAIDQYLVDTSPKTSMREVGELVSEVFDEQHESRKKHIHVALTTPRSEPPPPIPEGIEPIVQSRTGITASSMVFERKKQMVWTIGAAVGAAALAVIAMGGILIWRGGHDGASANPSAVDTTPSIQVRLTATPAAAQLAIDGAQVDGNPAIVKLPADTRDHEIRASLAGYEPFVKTVRFERDLSVDIMLMAAAASTAESVTKPADETAPPKAPKASRQGVASARIARPQAASTKPAQADCNPPFYFDKGIKVYKPNCL
ncbi:MAG TPA: hypothetical protein VIV60_28090, partial [Polyangiaceae bacterium]